MVSSRRAGSSNSGLRETTAEGSDFTTTGGDPHAALKPAKNSRPGASERAQNRALAVAPAALERRDSVSILVDETFPQGHRQYLEVEGIRPIANVEEIA